MCSRNFHNTAEHRMIRTIVIVVMAIRSKLKSILNQSLVCWVVSITTKCRCIMLDLQLLEFYKREVVRQSLSVTGQYKYSNTISHGLIHRQGGLCFYLRTHTHNTTHIHKYRHIDIHIWLKRCVSYIRLYHCICKFVYA